MLEHLIKFRVICKAHLQRNKTKSTKELISVLQYLSWIIINIKSEILKIIFKTGKEKPINSTKSTNFLVESFSQARSLVKVEMEVKSRTFHENVLTCRRPQESHNKNISSHWLVTILEVRSKRLHQRIIDHLMSQSDSTLPRIWRGSQRYTFHVQIKFKGEQWHC